MESIINRFTKPNPKFHPYQKLTIHITKNDNVANATDLATKATAIVNKALKIAYSAHESETTHQAADIANKATENALKAAQFAAQNLKLYQTKTHNEQIKLKFHKILTVKQRNLISIINVYTPTTELAKNDSKILETMYNQLNGLFEVLKQTIILIAGDFNAKVGKKSG